jgi:succinate-semialdehyde dehydrogenase/glutarate-semialdehyde dehydrogenase
MATRKIAPALAAGCTVVLKPAAETPLTALAIVELLVEAGVPAGVVNLVPTTDAPGVVSTWLADSRIRKISFTGSTGVGRTLLKQAADRVVNASMELGGNAPFVVTADADLAAVVDGAMIAKFRGSGQACTAANRFYVHADVADEFAARFGAAIAALRVGPASDPASQVGPLISARAADNVRHLVDSAVAEGAHVAAQAQIPVEGYYVAPTLLTGVPPTASILRQEIFGPVAPVVVWDDEEQRYASPVRSMPEWWASTAAWCPTRPHRSAGPNRAAWAAKAPATDCTSSRRRSTSASTPTDGRCCPDRRSLRSGTPGRVPGRGARRG